MSNAAQREQDQVLGFRFAERTSTPLTILGLMPWHALYSMGAGAGATAFMRSPTSLAAYGHHVHIVHPRHAGTPEEDSFAGIHFHRFRAPDAFSDRTRPVLPRVTSRLWRYHFFQAAAPRRLLSIGRHLRPDVVIAYGAMASPPARKVADTLECPLVGRHFGAFVPIDRYSNATLRRAIWSRLSWWGHFIERIGFRVPVQAMIFTNDGSPMIPVMERLGVDLTPIHYLRNGLPSGVFAPGPRPRELMERLGLPADAFILLTVTRLHAEKRIDRTIRALAGLRAQGSPAYAVMLGDGPEKERLVALAGELGVADAVRFPGPVANSELTPWYRMADVVLSLLDRTNASNPVFEAMACERCVVALDVGTTAEVVRGGVTGVLVPREREAELPLLLAELARDPDRREALGRRARAFILELLGTWEQRLRKEIGIVEEVARTRHVVPGNLV